MRRPRLSILISLALWLAPNAPARAATVQDFDTSIRAAGMGGATTAVGWGEPGVWGNPASLANVRGLAWLEGTTRLIPEIDPPVRLKSRRFLLGGYGVGLSLMGEPVDAIGHTRLDYNSTGTDPFGNVVVGPKLEDKMDGWGLGLSPIQLIDAIRAKTTPGATPIAQRVDLSIGYHHKHSTVMRTPNDEAETDNHDFGVLARVGLLPGDDAGRATRVEMSGGFAVLNVDESAHFVSPVYGDLGGATRIVRTGFAVRALLPFGDDDARPWAWPGAVPSAVGLGVAFDLDKREDPISDRTDDISHWGFEATFMEILAARVGYVDDAYHEIHKMTGGVGVHAPVGPWATVGYDWANQPSAPGMKNLNRHGWSVWLHPDAIWRSSQGAK